MAGSGHGKDDPPLDGEARAGWRRQALDWLKADLAHWTKFLSSGSPQAPRSIERTLEHWKIDPDLASIRDEPATARLPADEQEAYHALWAEVDVLLKQVRQSRPR